jgi:hypothetical protein
VHLRFGSSVDSRFYVAVEDILPPGFEADRSSLEAIVDPRVQSFCVRGDRVTFFIDTLEGTMELNYSIIPTLAGNIVAPPARLFPMYSPQDVVFSTATELTVRELAGAQDGAGNGILTGQKLPSGDTGAERTSGAKQRPSGAPASPALPPENEPVEEPLPDIALTGVQRSGEVRTGRMTVFIAEFSLSGFREDIPLVICAYVDGRLAKSENVRLSLSSDLYSMDFPWPVTAGKHTVRISADPDDQIAESDENNNEYTESFSLAARSSSARPQSSLWQAGLLAIDGLLVFLATVRLYKPVKGFMDRRKARKASVANACVNGKGT